jgi:putative DNA primase/helicase
MRPTALTVNADGIPDALRRERRWLLWRYDWDGKRWTKRPYQLSDVLAKSDDPSTWTTFAQACNAYLTKRFDGIGFALGNGWSGVDLDKCVADYNPNTGGLFATTDAVGGFVLALDRSNAYWEISPSGTGYKAIGRSARIGGEIKFSTTPPTFTTWSGARFFAITGQYQSASDDPTVDISQLIDDWFPLAPALNLSSTSEGYKLAAEMSDDDLLCQMIGGDVNGDAILTLWRGDISAYGNDHSRADLALCCHLAFWTNYDAERVDRMFRESGLYRKKWDRASYRRATLSKAIAQRPEVVVGEISYE